MQISVKTDFPSLKELTEGLSDIASSAILLGGDMRLIAKNSKAAKLFKNLRRGRHIRRLLGFDEELRIAEMTENTVLYTELRNCRISYGAAVACGEGYRLIILRPVDTDIRRNIENIYVKASGYDICLNASHIPKRSLNDNRRAGLAKSVLHLLKESGGLGELPFFDPRAVICGLKNALAETNGNQFGGMEVSSSSGRLAAMGSEKDFAMIAAYICCFCMDRSADGKINIETEEHGGEAELRFSAVTDMSPYEVSRLTMRKSTDVPCEDEYWFRLIRLLAHGNLWDFSIDSGSDGRIFFRILLPLAEGDDDCVLRDISPAHLRRIAEFVHAFSSSNS